MNVLLVTLDQFRADSFGAAGHSLVRTPTLDRIAREGVRLANHYSQSAPCSPGRACLYTGTYQMNNRVVANGTPHPVGFDNVARAARRAGYDPTLFGYTDQGANPLEVENDDVRLDDYDGILPGFSIGTWMPESQAPYLRWLDGLGYDVSDHWFDVLSEEPTRPAEHSHSAFLTDRFIDWLERRPSDSGWFAHLSYLRPHSPYSAAGEFSTMYDPADVEMPIEPAESERRHPMHDLCLAVEICAAPTTEEGLRRMRAQYYGCISEVDHQLGRAVAAIEAGGEWDDTLVVVVADHGEQLGDHGLKEKLYLFPQSYHIIGLWRDPRRADPGRVIERFTENVDILPTLCEALGLDAPVQCDGRSMVPLLDGRDVEWRSHAHYEWDWRYLYLGSLGESRPASRFLARQNLAVSVGSDEAYVQFGDGEFLCYDLAADPTWRTVCTDESRAFAAARELLTWRQEHLRRDLTDLLLTPDRLGRWPEVVGS